MAALRTFLDSGAPPDSRDYTTVVVIHGYGFHAGNFKKLVPLAPKFNARLVLPNRRDYPGSEPFTDEQRANLAHWANAPAGSPEAVKGTEEFMKERARETYDYLLELVKSGVVTPPNPGNTGGIILAGWSLGAVWLSALLTHVASFPVSDVKLGDYIRRIVYYDASYVCSGYSGVKIPDELYHPLHDPKLTPAEKVEHFGLWVASYYAHGDVWTLGAAALESRKALQDPPPTIKTLTPEEVAESVHSGPGETGGTEQLLTHTSITHGTYSSLQKRAFHLSEAADGDDWRHVEVRWLWCDRSIWEMPLVAYTVARELEEAKRQGETVRNVNFVRFHGANHFAHWDFPEKTLRAFVGNDKEIL